MGDTLVMVGEHRPYDNHRQCLGCRPDGDCWNDETACDRRQAVETVFADANQGEPGMSGTHASILSRVCRKRSID